MRNIIQEIRNKIDDLYLQLKLIQEQCSHPEAARLKENKGSTGGWDRDESYWTEHHCFLCDKKWTTPQ
jgi:hypothetical protein